LTFREDIKRPFNIVTLILAFISIVISVIFYYGSQQEKRIAYVQSEPSKIFDSSASRPALRVLDKNNEVVNQDVFVRTYTVWNAGNLPIEPAEVRKPINVIFPISTKILGLEILGQTRGDVANCKLVDSSMAQEVRSASLTWDHFDPGFGVKFQIIYTGATPEAKLDGYIVGVDELEEGVKSKVSRYLPFRRGWGGVSIAVLLIFIIFVVIDKICDRMRDRLLRSISTERLGVRSSVVFGSVVLEAAVLIPLLTFLSNLLFPKLTPPL